MPGKTLTDVKAVAAGLLVGMAFNTSLIVLNSYILFPMPAGYDFNNHEHLAAYIPTLPVSAFLVVIVAHLGQAFVGAIVAAFMQADPVSIVPRVVVGGITLMGGVANFMGQLGTLLPLWMYAELPFYLVASHVGGSVGIALRKSKQSHTS